MPTKLFILHRLILNAGQCHPSFKLKFTEFGPWFKISFLKNTLIYDIETRGIHSLNKRDKILEPVIGKIITQVQITKNVNKYSSGNGFLE